LHAVEVSKRIRKKSIPCDGVVDQATVDRTATGLTEDEAGRRLFELAAACREAGIDPESALRRHAGNVVSRLTERRHNA
jgi:XTP/dITP diphosphohydrolase/tetrapyrrole methylase family protein/MazG family protein